LKKTWVVLRNEVITTVTRRSFLLLAIGMPLIGFLIFWGVTALRESAATTEESTDTTQAQEMEIEGFIDLGGVIQEIPEDIPAGKLLRFSDEASAQAALEAGEITAYYVVPEDYLEEGELRYVHPDANPISASGQLWVMRWVLLYNLVDGDIELAGRVFEPMDVQRATLAPSEPSGELQPDTDSAAKFVVPYATTLIFYVVILLASSLLLRSVNEEKKNRVIEILMSSITPRQMLTGKILGLGVVGLIQTVIWVGTGYALLRLRGQSISLPAGMELPPSILLWGLVFFLLGYGVYASLMAGLGALVPNMREATQATFVIVSPLILVLFFINILIDDPHGSMVTVLSLFPLTSPVAMMMRLTIGGVPFWHLAVAVALLVIAVIVIIRAVARMFQAQTLLSGQPFSTRRFFAALFGRT
jgi:ABC-2 type transport system permease protein